MTTPADCSFNTDPLKLIREGTSQHQRMPAALNPQYASVNERRPEHGMVFAQAYSKFLQYYNTNNVQADNWEPFFGRDVSVQLAGVAVEDIRKYRQSLREYAAFLNDRGNRNDKSGLRDRVDFLFSACATLAIGLDRLTTELPGDLVLRNTIHMLVQSRLALALKRLIEYRKGGEAIGGDERPLNEAPNEKVAKLRILGMEARKWSDLASASLSKDWMTEVGTGEAD